jgi:hypothetical protein
LIPATATIIIGISLRAAVTGTGVIKVIPRGTLVAFPIIVVGVISRATGAGLFIIHRSLAAMPARPVIVVGISFRTAMFCTGRIFVIASTA